MSYALMGGWRGAALALGIQAMANQMHSFQVKPHVAMVRKVVVMRTASPARREQQWEVARSESPSVDRQG